MRARPGDWIVMPGGENRDRRGLVLSARTPAGDPPFLVRWLDGHEAYLVPGPDARVVTAAELARADLAERNRLAALQRELSQHAAQHPVG